MAEGEPGLESGSVSPDAYEAKRSTSEPSNNPYCEAMITHSSVENNDVVKVSCDACPLDEITLYIQGADSRSLATGNEFAKVALKDKCGKWQRRLMAQGVSGTMPDSLLSKVKVTV